MKKGQFSWSSLEERFWVQTEKSSKDECWVWKGHVANNGYGQIKDNYRTRNAHRVSFEIHFGPIPDKKHICHKCDNRSCVNPHHLFVGTAQQNVDDKIKKGRNRYPLGETHGMAKLSAQDAAYIRNSVEKGVDLAKKFGVSAVAISNIRTGRRWSAALSA